MERVRRAALNDHADVRADATQRALTAPVQTISISLNSRAMRRIDNPKNRFERTELVWDEELPPHAALELHEEHAKSILSENDSPDIGFRYSLNPYRGCFHGCAYCYARPSHQYWGFGAGTDFERK